MICSCFVLSFVSQTQAVLGPPAATATIVNFGIYEVVKKGMRYEHKESTAGYTEKGGDLVLVETTTEVPLKKGIAFGIEWEAQGLPSIPIKITWRVKHPRTTKPDGTVSAGFDETLRVRPKEGKIGRRFDCYILSEDWEMLPGEWCLSVVYEGKVLCEKVFHVLGQ
jgi:hypothetical protein